ncbi:MAG: hypothetical protein CMJ50_00195 [Planctomycetaceae bacterium]|nr:hypothetical protein [Planctomycetaceae bacterium]
MVSDDGTVAICCRVRSQRPLPKFSGWRHQVAGAKSTRRSNRRPTSSCLRSRLIGGGSIHRQCLQAITDADVSWLADELGVTSHALRDLEVGHYEPTSSFSFPMRSADTDQVVGIRTRDPNSGQKRCVTGSMTSLFIPRSLFSCSPMELLVVEGESDLAALLSVGLPGVGRPSCRGCEQDLIRLTRRLRIRHVCLIADSDDPGLKGAAAARKQLGGYVHIRIITPGQQGRDIRQIVAAGADQEQLLGELISVR